MPNFWRTGAPRIFNICTMVSFEYIDFWPKILLFRTCHLWNSTTELILVHKHEILNFKTVWLKRIRITPRYQCMTVYTLHRFLTFTAINGEEVELRLTTHYVSINILPFCFNIYILLLYTTTFPSNVSI